MNRRYPTRIGDIINRDIRNSDPFIRASKEEKVMDNWRKVVGDTLAEYTTRLYMRGNKLYVGFSGVLPRSEFYKIRGSVLYKLNGIVGEKFIVSIIVL